MKRNPLRMAWVILLFAFALFCLTAVAVPLGARWHISNAEDTQEALVESLVGTVVVEKPVGLSPMPLGKGQSMTVPEGTVIRTDETSEAVVTFFDHSFLRLSSGSRVRIDRLRASRYESGERPNSVYLDLQGGGLSIGTALSLDAPLSFQVTTLHGQILLAADGTYALQTTNDRSEIAAYRGQATITAAGETVVLAPRQRTWVDYQSAPEPPTDVARNMVVNGDFAPLGEEWRVFNDQGADGGEIDGKAELVVDEGRRAVRFVRLGVTADHCETILDQTIDQQLPDPVSSLIVRGTVKVRHQSLSGGGYLSSEYPLMIRMTYRDVYDSEAEWVQGFYVQNPDNSPTTSGLQIPRDDWYLFETPNLLETLPVTPYRIIRLRVYASGWEYESFVSDISLIVE